MRQKMFFPVFLVVAFLLTSCGVPREVKEVMIAKIEDEYSPIYEVKNIRIIQSNKLALTEKDKANGIEEQWCIKASFIYHYADSDSWWSDGLLTFEAYLRRGEWNYYFPQFDRLDDPWRDGYMDDLYTECLGW